MSKAMARNDMGNLVHKTVSGALRHSCAFMTVTRGHVEWGEPPTVVSAYPLTASSAIWDEARRRIGAGMVVVAGARRTPRSQRAPTMVYVFTDESLIVISRPTPSGRFAATYVAHSMGRVPMEPVAYHATLERPFGRSRITRTVMGLVDDAQREMLNMTAAASFSAMPQKYLMGADKTTAETIASQPFGAFIGSLFVGTTNKRGQTPQFGQLAQLPMQPHIDYMRSLAAQFSGTTGAPLSSLGVVSDNPSSAEAIAASIEPLIIDAKNLNRDNGCALRNVAYMALAVLHGTDFATERDAGLNVNARFMSPAYPSVVSQSDAMLKQVQALPKIAASDVALETLGYTDEQMQRINSDYKKAQANQAVLSLLTPKEDGDGDTAQPA